MGLDVSRNSGRQALSSVLLALGNDTSHERISVADLLKAMGDRALAALLFVFALPNVLPTPPGTSTLLGAPLVFLAAQLALGRRPWLPALIAKRSMSRDDFRTLVRRTLPWLVRAERLLRPRASGFALAPMEYVVGFICLLLAVVLVLPIPFGNMLPALAICLMALGILERDGLWVVAGLVAAVASAIVVSGVVFALGKTTLFLIRNVV